MAVTTVPVTTLTKAGDDPDTGGTAPTHATDGIKFNNDGRTWIWVENQNAAAITLTFVTPKTVAGLTVADPTVAIGGQAAEPYENLLIGPFSPDAFNDGDGNVAVTVSANGTDLRFKAYRM